MGTKIQANGFLRDYHSVIDLDGSHGNQILENNCQNPDLFTPSASSTRGNGHLRYNLEKVRQTILQHESIFRSQLQELHRLYRSQKELMNEIKRRETNRVDLKEVKSQSSFSFSPAFPHDAKSTLNAPYSMSGFSLASGSSSKPIPTFLEGKVVPNFPPLQDTRVLTSCEPWMSSKSIICPNGTYGLRIQADVCSGNAEKRMQGRFSCMPGADRDTKLSLGAVQTSECNADALTLDLYSKRQNTAEYVRTTDGIPDNFNLARGVPANSSPSFNLAAKCFFQRIRNHHQSDEYAEKMRFNKHLSVGDFGSGKLLSFPQPPLAEQRKELSQRTRKLFGVEIEGCDNPSAVASKTVLSSWIDKSSAENLELGGVNANGSKTETLKVDSKGINGNWAQRSSAIEVSLDNLLTQSAEIDPRKGFPSEVQKKDPEHSRNFPQLAPHGCTALVDCHKNHENLKGLPWFLKNSQDCDKSIELKSPYLMNLETLHNCSQNFFKETETADVQKKEMVNERSTGTAKILGFPISDMLLRFESQSSGEDSVKVNPSAAGKFIEDGNKDIVLQKRINNYIDLNLSLDEEASPSAPFVCTTIVKIATTEIDLEAPAVIEPERDASPVKTGSSKMNLSSDEACFKFAAEALIAISSHRNSADDKPPNSASVRCLKWFAQVVSSRSGRTAGKEDSVPDGMDYFEYMTLKLEDQTKEEQYHYESVVLSHVTDDETGNAALLKRSRRRGRQWKDFQRDILPGMITLSRLEVAEDLQTFDEMMKCEGNSGSRQSTRNGRGRKRAGGQCPTGMQQPNCQMEDRSLTGWGKRTRRLPRQRCHNAFLSFPAVKC